MREHHIVTQRTARYYVLGGARVHALEGETGADSAGARSQAGPSEVWFALHGYAQLARYFVRPFEAIADASRLIVAPEALNRFYFERTPSEPAHRARVAATWMTREDRDHEIDDYISYLDRLAEHVLSDVGSPAITVLGFSQGAATASRWAARGQTRIRRLILWGSSLAHELVPAADLFRGADLTIALGTADPYLSKSRIAAELERLSAAGLQHTLLCYEGGHGIDADGLRQLAAAAGPPSSDP
jgi:predicted esterase